MTRAEIKANAREQLGKNIFCNLWMMGLLACLIVAALSSAAGAAIPGIGAIIITGPLAYGQSVIFLRLARRGGSIDLGDVFVGFKDDFGGTLLIGLMSGIFVFLWSLLLVVPGIVKTYAYSMAFYVKADHPDYDWKQCLNGSQELMRGHKSALFIQDLSFIGWYIVGALCLGVGTLWVTPYAAAAKTVFYENIKNNAAV